MGIAITPAIGNGRGITNYYSSCEMENKLYSQFRIGSDAEYRAKLQQNPAPFDAVIKQYATFDPYWPVNPCADAKTMSNK